MTTEPLPRFLSTGQFAKLVGCGRSTCHRWCVEHDNFAIKVDERRWKIPASHAARVLAGEPITSIAANPSRDEVDETPSPVDAAGAELASAREQLIRAYTFALGLAHHQETVSPQTRAEIVGVISRNLRQVLQGLGVNREVIRNEILVSGALADYRAVSGIRATI